MSSDGLIATHIDLPYLPEGWIWKSLSELVDPNRGICYGIVQPGKHDPIGVPMVNTGDVSDGKVASDIAFKVSTDLHSKFRRSTLRGGELLVTLVGANFGRVAIAPERFKGFNCSRAVGVVPLIEDAKYVMFALRSPLTRHLMDTWANTTAQPTFNLKDLGNLPIPLPPKFEREAIAEAISAFDDRITLLRETNTTLEAIAQALFKSWFVDFDPVHAKMQGRAPEGMDEATAALFPDSFEDSELGPVPKGWSVGSVGDFARLKKGTVNPGSQPDTVFEHFSLPAFDDGQNPVIESGASIKSNKTPVPEDAVLLSKLNPHIPRIWLPVNAGRNAVCSTEFLVFQPNGVGSRELIYCLFSSPDFISKLQQLVTGTSNSHQRIKPDQVALMTNVVPAASVASAFEILTRPIFERVDANRQKVQTLTSIRDALLPRLISGQLHVAGLNATLNEEVWANEQLNGR